MARDESHREDLMAEATALVPRAEFCSPAGTPRLVAGFKRDGSLSLYLGEDPVYAFDTSGRLRRAFVDGLLYRTQGDTLAMLRRDRSVGGQVSLLRHDLDEQELTSFRERLVSTVALVLEEMESGLLNQSVAVPGSADVTSRLIQELRHVLAADPWLAARIAGKR
tara:strand:+ start:2483 stop:2977 length:495 start_codon:yes stop_codon:yes gene_type:complete